MKRIGFIFYTLFLMFPICLIADDYQKSDKFFDANNALTPLGKNQNNTNYKKDSIFNKKLEYFNEEEKKGEKKLNKEKTLEKKGDIIADSNDMELVSGNKIINLGLVVNGINKKHFTQVMEKFMTAVDDFDLDAGHIYFNGFYNTDDSSTTLPLVARGASVTFHYSIPEQFNISLSPTWIVQTADGLILLEGIKNLNRYINKKGEFVENGVPMEQRMSEREDNNFKGGSIFSD